MLKIPYFNIFHPQTFPCYKPKISIENDYNVLGRDAQFKYVRARSLRTLSYKYVFYNYLYALSALAFFTNMQGRLKQFWIFDYRNAYEINNIENEKVFVNDCSGERGLFLQDRYYVPVPKRQSNFRYLALESANNLNYCNLRAWQLKEIGKTTLGEVLIFDSAISNVSNAPNQSYYPNLAALKVDEMNFLQEIIPVRFDSDSFTLTQKTHSATKLR